MNRFLVKIFKQVTFYNILNRYVSRLFLFNLFKIFVAFFLIIFLVNLIDNLDNVDSKTVSFFSVFYVSILKAPDFLNSISPSLVLFASLATFHSLSSHSEIVIIRVSGFSIWHIVLPIAITSFIVGIVWIFIYNNISIESFKLAQKIESSRDVSKLRKYIAPKSGIWIRQNNSEYENGFIIIKSKLVYKDNIEMVDNSLWFFNNEYNFYKRIDNKSMLLRDGYWQISSAIINQDKVYNKNVIEKKVETNLQRDVFSEKFLNYLEDPRLFSVYRLPGAIDDLHSLGLDSTKFKVQFNYLLMMPVIFVAMILLSSFFSMNNFRDLRSSIKLVVGIAAGLFVYISISFIKALGSSKIIPIFLSTWVVALMCLALSVILIYQKEDKN